MRKKDDDHPNEREIVAVVGIERRIHLVRGHRVILDAELATLYGVPTKRFNEQVKRNAERFPPDFMFQLTEEEFNDLRSQIATSKSGSGGRRYLPYVFTEHGALMAANLLNSEEAVKVSVYVVRAFVQLREVLSTHRELSHKLGELERRLQNHDRQIVALICAIRQLMDEPKSPRKPPIGYQTEMARKKKAASK